MLIFFYISSENVFNSERFDLDQFMKSKLALFYTRDGKPLRAGDYIKREDLAATLDRIVEHGAEDFYTGGLANDIQEAVSMMTTLSEPCHAERLFRVNRYIFKGSSSDYCAIFTFASLLGQLFIQGCV